MIGWTFKKYEYWNLVVNFYFMTRLKFKFYLEIKTWNFLFGFINSWDRIYLTEQIIAVVYSFELHPTLRLSPVAIIQI